MQKNYWVNLAGDSEVKVVKSYKIEKEGMSVEKWVKILVAYKMLISKVGEDLI
jgi:hypothetical protein